MPVDAAASSPSVPDLQHRIEVLESELRALAAERDQATIRQAAAGEVLQVINSSPGELRPVFDAMLESATRLCDAAFGILWLCDGERFHAAALHGVPERYAEIARVPVRPSPNNPLGRMLRGERVIVSADAADDELYRTGDAVRRALVDVGGARSYIQVALVKDTLLGSLTVYRTEARPFSDGQVSLLESFAAHAVTAIDNARLLTEQREALAQQTATAEILQVINSSPGRLEPVFDAMLDRALRLCEADAGFFATYDNERPLLAALQGLPPDVARTFTEAWRGEEGPRLIHAESGTGRIMRGETIVHIVDSASDEVYRSGNPGRRILVDIGGARTQLCTALRKDAVVLGVMIIWRREVRGFTDKQIALLQSFAAQAVIAMENVRLFTELRESLEQQTATGEILRAISQSPTDVQPVLEAVAKAAVRFCGAPDAIVLLRDGDDHVVVAHEGALTATLGLRRPIAAANFSGKAMLEGKTLQIADVDGLDAALYAGVLALARQHKWRASAAAPMMHSGKAIGCVVLRKPQPGLLSSRQIELLEAFAAQAVIAIENVRLFTELKESLEQQTATGQILQVISQSPTNVQPVLDAVVAAAVRLCGAQDALIAMPDGGEYAFAAHRGPLGGDLGARAPITTGSVLGRVMLTGQTIHVPDVLALDPYEYPLSLQGAQSFGFRAMVGAPMLQEGNTAGVLMLRKSEPGPFGERQIALLETFAAQAVIAIENVRLFTELRESLERLKAAQANLIQAEKMASLGQLTAGIAHEIKNPLNFVNNFAGLSGELVEELKQAVAALLAEPDEEKRAELQDIMDLLTGNLAKIVEHGRRADGIVKSMLAHSRGGTGDWQSSNINGLVEEALNLAYHGARAQDSDFNVTLVRDFAGDVKPIEVVPQDVTRVLLNLFSNGFYAATNRHRLNTEAGYRPTLGVTTRDLGDAVEITVRDNGTGIQPEVRARLFQPFFTTKPTGEGTGLGLSISYDIVTHQHGGTIEVESEPGSFSQFTIRLPRRGRMPSDDMRSPSRAAPPA